MKGICSATPGQTAVRLLVGTHLLLLVQCWLVLCSGVELDGMLRVIVGGTATLGLLAFAVAIHGGPAHSGSIWQPNRRALGPSGGGRP